MDCGKDSGYRYESVFAHAGFQFCGHIDEYLIANARHLTLLRTQTRFGKGGHLLERYEEGRLVEERRLWSSRNVFLYYLIWAFHCNKELWRCSHRVKGVTVALLTHPAGCLFMGIHRLFGRVKYAFWAWDWFPPTSLPLKVYAAIMRYYVRHVDFAYALTQAIAGKIGGNASVVMLGMKRQPCADVDRSESKRLLVVGQLRHGQGIEKVLDFLAEHQEYSLTLLGAAANGYEQVIEERIRSCNLDRRVEFPNRFVSQEELSAAASKCFCGLALYDTSPGNFTHYADPGKVKSYIEMGLPVVMTRISEIVSYVEKFKAGEVIDSITDLPDAVVRIASNPAVYADGVQGFAAHFEFNGYYGAGLAFAKSSSCVPRRFFVSYGDGRYIPAGRRIVDEAVATGEFDVARLYGREDVSGDVRNCPAFSVPRGAGLWAWKPDVILKMMGEMSNGDVLVYCDAGCSLRKGREWKRIWREMESCDLLAQRIYQKMERWSRIELVHEFDDISFHGLHQFMAGAIIAVKSDFTVRFFSEWRRYMIERPELFVDVTPEERQAQLPCFSESRHDQSIFSALVYRNLADPETRKRIHARWEHVENIDAFRSQGIMATRWSGESPYRPPWNDRIKACARRFLKDFIWKPFIASPVQHMAERRNGIR